MATILTKIEIDSEIKKDAVDLFNELVLDLSTAINIFLHQCVLEGGIPIYIENYINKNNQSLRNLYENDYFNNFANTTEIGKLI